MTLRRTTPREAQEMHGLKNWRYAWLRNQVRGGFTKFRKGTKVRAKWNKLSRTYTIERDTWRGSMVPLANMLAGIPRSVIILAKPDKPKAS